MYRLDTDNVNTRVIESAEGAGFVIFSEKLGLLPCRLVAENDSHALVILEGMTSPVKVARSNVFDLDAQGEGDDE